MITVRTYTNPIEAALAKSVLDNYEIRCAVLDENSNLYSRGAQFAVPIRLVVDENDAERALCILKEDFEKAGELEPTEEDDQSLLEAAAATERSNRNPWEFLVLAFYLAVPAICLIWTRFPIELLNGRWGRHYIARATITHFLSWLAIFLAVALVVAYFWVRRSSPKSTSKTS